MTKLITLLLLRAKGGTKKLKLSERKIDNIKNYFIETLLFL